MCPLPCLSSVATVCGPARAAASLLYPDGRYFVGPLNGQYMQHGPGVMYSAAGVVLREAVWDHGFEPAAAAAPAPSVAFSAPTAPLPPAYDVFISHKQSDTAQFCRMLYDRLTMVHGYKVGQKPNTSFPPGQECVARNA